MTDNYSLRLLKANERNTMPERMVFFDCETNYERKDDSKVIHTLDFGFACYWRHRRDGDRDRIEWLRFEDSTTFWDWTLAKTTVKTKTYLIAHNLAFDLMVVRGFEELANRGWMTVFIYESGHTRIIKFGYPTKEFRRFLTEGREIEDFRGRRWQKTILAIDNSNLFAGKLARWGETLGLEKLKMPARGDSKEAWDRYCQRDVEIMLRLWQRWFAFLREHDLGSWRPTIASQAFAAYRHRFMNHRIWLHDCQEAISLERESYYGGRSEAFFVGEVKANPVYKLDVNSMYPFVMREHEYPVCLKGFSNTGSIELLIKLLTKYAVIAKVTIECDEPVFPWHKGNRNIYPTGRFTTTLCTPELKYAIDKGFVVKVEQIAWYRTRPIFVEFVEYFYSMKVKYGQEGDKLNRNLIKLVMNSLYGKFGQRGFVDQFVRECEPDRYEVEHVVSSNGKNRYTIYRVGGSVIRSERKGEGHNSFVAIASHVTAYARMYLWQLIQTAGREHVFYCDTDSLFVDNIGLERLKPYLDDSRLGGLKVEDVSDCVVIHAPKDYEFGQTIKRKGVPKESQQLSQNQWEVELWPSLRGLLGQGIADHYENTLVCKTLKREVKWGVLTPSGWVRPILLPEEAMIPPENLYQIECLQAQIEALENSIFLEPNVVFRFWDYHSHMPRRVRDKYGNLVTWEKAVTDEVAQELGFSSAVDFMREVERTANVWQSIRQLKAKIDELRNQ